jgi:hypothetical protein
VDNATHEIYLRAVDKEGHVDPIPANWTFLSSSRSRTSLQKADRAYIPENKTGGIIGDPIIPPSPSPPAPEEEEITIPEDLKLPRIYGNQRERPVYRGCYKGVCAAQDKGALILRLHDEV